MERSSYFYLRRALLLATVVVAIFAAVAGLSRSSETLVKLTDITIGNVSLIGVHSNLIGWGWIGAMVPAYGLWAFVVNLGFGVWALLPRDGLEIPEGDPAVSKCFNNRVDDFLQLAVTGGLVGAVIALINPGFKAYGWETNDDVLKPMIYNVVTTLFWAGFTTTISLMLIWISVEESRHLPFAEERPRRDIRFLGLLLGSGLVLAIWAGTQTGVTWVLGVMMSRVALWVTWKILKVIFPPRQITAPRAK